MIEYNLFNYKMRYIGETEETNIGEITDSTFVHNKNFAKLLFVRTYKLYHCNALQYGLRWLKSISQRWGLGSR